MSNLKICTNCVLPETYPGITFDEKGVCNFCNSNVLKKKQSDNGTFTDESEFIEYLNKYLKTNKSRGKYNVLVPVSGGVDSCTTLIDIVEKYKLKPLVFHNDHGYEEEVATRNVRKLCKELNVDLIVWEHDFDFMKRMWKYSIKSNVRGMNACYICGNIIYLNAIEIANNFGISLITNGYTKGMVPILNNKEKNRNIFDEYIQEVMEYNDKEFINTLMKKNELLNKQEMFSEKNDLLIDYKQEKILVLPFYFLKFNITDKDKLTKKCKERFDWEPISSSYPARTTNCKINWLNVYMDLKKMNYTFYHDEYSSLIRAKEMSREEVLKDLKFDPPHDLIDQLKNMLELDEDKDIIKAQYADKNIGDDIDFDF